MSFGKYNRMPNSLIRDPGDTDIRPQNAKRGLGSLAFWKRSVSTEDDDNEEVVTDHTQSAARLNQSAAGLEGQAESLDTIHQAGLQFPIGAAPSFKQGYSFLPDAPVNPDVVRQKAVPAPSPRFDASSLSVRDRRFLGFPHGGTVVVHYLKRNEWFLETALALLGRSRMWDTGLEAPAYRAYVPPAPPGKPAPPELPQDAAGQGKNVQLSPVPTWNTRDGEIEVMSPYWGGARMYGSPLIRDNGFISLGRTVPWDALQKSEEARYGRLKSSPRQGYADLPSSKDDSQTLATDSKVKGETSAPKEPSTSADVSSSATHQHSGSSSSSLTQHSEEQLQPSHTSSASLAELQTDISSTSSPREAEQHPGSNAQAGLHIQNPAIGALNLS